MNTPVFVVDTSALVDTVQVDNDAWADAFARVQSKYDVLAPLRVVYEVGNIIHRKHPEVFGTSLEERQEVVAEVLRGIKIAPWDPKSVARVGAFAERFGVTYYDATFLDLAFATERSVLLVQDRKLHTAATSALDEDRVFNLDQLTEAVEKNAFQV